MKKTNIYFILCFLVMLLVSCSKETNTQSIDDSIELKASNIVFTFIGKSASESIDAFNEDVENGAGLGIIKIEDKLWNRFVARAFTFEEELELNESLSPTYDMVVQTEEERLPLKIWKNEDSVFYSHYPDKPVYQMSDEDAQYFNMVMKNIENDMK